AKAHGEALGAEEVQGARVALSWPYAPFEIPDDIRSDWLEAGRRSAPARKAWEMRLANCDRARRAEFEATVSGEMPASIALAIAAFKTRLATEKPTVATRKASEMALEVVTPLLPSMIGGSADLTGSVFTKMKGDAVISPGAYAGRFIHYGVREHGMAAAM